MGGGDHSVGFWIAIHARDTDVGESTLSWRHKRCGGRDVAGGLSLARDDASLRHGSKDSCGGIRYVQPSMWRGG